MIRSIKKFARLVLEKLQERIPRTVVTDKFTFQFVGVTSRGSLNESLKIYGCYERPFVSKLLQSISEDDICWDIGAAQGYYSLILCHCVKDSRQVVCIEPNSARQHFLEANLRRYRFEPTIINKLISNTDSGNSVKLDTLCTTRNQNPSLLKMDIEGGEILAIQGAEKLIASAQPKIFVEVHPSKIESFVAGGTMELFERLAPFYEFEFVKNHWGSPKGSEDFAWRKGTKAEMIQYCEDVLAGKTKHKVFALYCKPRLTS